MRQTTTTGVRTTGTVVAQRPITWTDVREWAASRGITSAAALKNWLGEITRRYGTGQPTDPRERYLLRALARFARIMPNGGAPPPLRDLSDVYEPLLETLSAPGVGSRVDYEGPASRLYFYPPGIGGRDWITPLVDPLAEGGRLWPPTPVTALARLNEVANAAFGYSPPDTNALIRSWADSPLERPVGFSSDVAHTLQYIGIALNRILGELGEVRAHPDAPGLVSPETLARARIRWPNVTQNDVMAPFVVMVARGEPMSRHFPYGIPRRPIHVALIAMGDYTPVSLIVADDTGEVIALRGPHDMRNGEVLEQVVRQDNRRPMVDLLKGFIDVVRAGQYQDIGFEELRGSAIGPDRWSFAPIGEPFYGRVFEPAELLAALEERTRSSSVQRIDDALRGRGATGARSLADIAARAYRGNLTDVNVPEEVRTRAAAQAAARACSPDAPDADRARLAEAASVLGIQGPLLEGGDLTALCDASASAVERLYRGITGETSF